MGLLNNTCDGCGQMIGMNVQRVVGTKAYHPGCVPIEFPSAEYTAAPSCKPDSVSHPSHYTSSPARCQCGKAIECIDVTEHMSFCEGNVVKYVWRADHKGSKLQDLKKAEWYIKRAIALEEARLSEGAAK